MKITKANVSCDYCGREVKLYDYLDHVDDEVRLICGRDTCQKDLLVVERQGEESEK